MVVDASEVRGIWVDGKLFCIEHVPEGTWDNIKQADLVLESDIDEDHLYFCDECGSHV